MAYRISSGFRMMKTSVGMLTAAFLSFPFAGFAACGAENQTPCKLWERVPSCDAGLVENVLQGKCLKSAATAQAESASYLKNAFGKCLHVPEETRQDGVQLRTWTCIDKTHLKWEIVTEPISSPVRGTFQIKNVKTGKCIGVQQGQKLNGSWVVQLACQSHHSYTNVRWGYNGGMLVQNESNKCLHVGSDAQYAEVTIQSCGLLPTPNNMKWTHDKLK